MIAKREDAPNFIQNLETFGQAGREESEWLADWRRRGLARFRQLGIPTLKNEDWKYTNINPLVNQEYTIASNGPRAQISQLTSYADPNDLNIVLVNGKFSAELSGFNRLTQGLKISSLREAVSKDLSALEPFLTKYRAEDEDAFTALNRALVQDGVWIQAADKAILKNQLIHIIHVTETSGQEICAAPRTLVTIGQSSEVTILESHLCFSDSSVYFNDCLTDIFVGPNATAHYCRAQNESPQGFHISQTRVHQERDSNFHSFVLTTQGAIVRNNLNVFLDGEGSSTLLNGLYSVHGRQLVDNHTSVVHSRPNAVSTQLYKGILTEAAHAVFNGKILVRPAAQKTNSYQLNKNLLLGKDCRVDTKPQLEIFADDVKCTHGATIGQLNEDEVFYLQTRCIPRKEAVRMLARGFVEEIVGKIQNGAVQDKLRKLLKPSLDALTI